MRISDWSSDVCSSDLSFPPSARRARTSGVDRFLVEPRGVFLDEGEAVRRVVAHQAIDQILDARALLIFLRQRDADQAARRRVHRGFLELAGVHLAEPLEARDLDLLALERPRLDRRAVRVRSEEHTSELQSLMRNSYAVFCLKKKTITNNNTTIQRT